MSKQQRIRALLWLGALLILTGCGQKKELQRMEQETDTLGQTLEVVSTITTVPESTNSPTPMVVNRVTPTDVPACTDALLPGLTTTPTLTPTPKPSVTVTMVGDILLHTRIHDYSMQADGNYNYDAIFANLAEEISEADLALVNQEVVLGGSELGVSGYPGFNAPGEVGDALIKAGFDVVLHATNHALDKRGKGILNTLNFWEDNYPEVGVLGIHDSKEDQEELYVAEINGIRIAILNYTYGTNGIAMPADMPFAVDMLEEETVIEDIRQAKEQADFVIVCPHWGTEYRLSPDKSQTRWTKLFLEQGVDLVLGTHPHVIEPVELLVQEESGEQMLVYYSIGNFVNWTSGTGEGVANRMVGGMPDITIALDEQGNAYIADYGITAVVCHVEKKTNGITVYPLAEYTEELAGQNAIRSQDSNFSPEYCTNLCDEVWGDLWK